MDAHNHDQASVRTIEVSEFESKCFEMMDEVTNGGVEITITKNGRPVSQLLPYRHKPKSLFGIDRGKLEILGDIDEQLDVIWEAATGNLEEDAPASPKQPKVQTLGRAL